MKAARFLVAALLASLGLLGCGGGGGGSTPVVPPPAATKLVGEIFCKTSELTSSELKFTAGYTGNVAVSRALQAAGKQNLLDLLFMFAPGTAQGNPRTSIAPDAEQRLVQYAKDNADLLTPGIRVLVADEVYWNPAAPTDSVGALQAQLDALSVAIALVRKHIPQASIGITITPYATFGKPNTLEFVKRAVARVNWVGTDPYWFGNAADIPQLHDWSRTFHALAKQANPQVETWFIAQAFKESAWNTATYNAFTAEQLGYAEQYDHIIFFGWQFVSEIDLSTAGVNFPAETKRLYQKYLK
ncbi:MAG: hypothetical protein CFE44_18580 [Burkholderiales bacterium PBB4]|nr:MAG: hypothetical protein CFE44_18580 [Burkholderiales bacterium PBB4]